MARVSFVILTVLVTICCIDAYPNGAPATPTTCADMTPGHINGIDAWPNQFKTPYSVVPACYVLEPDELMEFRLRDVRRGGGLYRGIFLMVREGEDLATNRNTVGSFAINDVPTLSADNPVLNFKATNCFGRSKSAVTHRSSRYKNSSLSAVTWIGPKTCKENEIFYIKATVAKEKNMVQRGISVPIICNADISNVQIMEKIRPIHPELYCRQLRRGSWAIIPKFASESFESENLPIGGWSHMFSDPKQQFKRGMGSTATLGTGPDAAKDGKYYMYFEASGTYQFQSAGLISPPDLTGCFCFSFWCHMNTDRMTRFRVSIIGLRPRTIVDIVEVTDYWRQVSYNFKARTPVTIAIQVFSSGKETGDVGIDDIRIEAGHCPGGTPVIS